MSENPEPQFLYLTTIGRKSGKPHQIEIWFVKNADSYYLVNEHPEISDWVKNIRHNSAVMFSIGSRDANAVEGRGRLVDAAAEPELAAAVSALMDAKYQWSDGQIVELKPTQ
jgi:deazaflavin-dependent oxidoreductase (nitroreductase family)